MNALQQDHHCILQFGGKVWRIDAVRGPIVVTICQNGCCIVAIDTTGMRFDRYCNEAVLLDYANAAAAQRGTTTHPGSEARN